jgi:RNA-directed DNA polymerase
MPPDWFRPRSYRHLDAPVGSSFATKVLNPTFVAQHPWSPLISYVKRQKRYKPKDRKTVFKDRPIMFASHRDACILSRYATEVSDRLDEAYAKQGLARSPPARAARLDPAGGRSFGLGMGLRRGALFSRA